MVDSTNAFLPEPVYVTEKKNVKVATPDILLDDPMVSLETMADYGFASVAGIELLSASRHDLINSPYNNGYTPITDAGSVFTNIPSIVFDDSSKNIFNTFTIDLNYHTPQLDENPLIESDTSSGNIIISLKNLQQEYIVEVETLITGIVIDDTIG